MSVTVAPLLRGTLAEATALLERACAFDAGSSVASEKLFDLGAGDLVAEPLGAFAGDQLLGVACTSGKWIRLLAVDPAARDRGVGVLLLSRCEAQIANHGATARTLDQPGNYLSPGIDTQNQQSIDWLAKRGYRPCGSATNLLIALQDNAKVSEARLLELRSRCEHAGYALLRLSSEHIETLMVQVRQTFSEGWAFEVARSARQSQGVHIAVERSTGMLAAFAAHDGNNAGLGWFGPTGTMPAHRGRGLGGALLMSCLIDIQSVGLSHCQVAWIGPRDFYEKIAGVEGERNFVVLQKEVPQ